MMNQPGLLDTTEPGKIFRRMPPTAERQTANVNTFGVNQ
jgi:hypothetical protein